MLPAQLQCRSCNNNLSLCDFIGIQNASVQVTGLSSIDTTGKIRMQANSEATFDKSVCRLLDTEVKCYADDIYTVNGRIPLHEKVVRVLISRHPSASPQMLR